MKLLTRTLVLMGLLMAISNGYAQEFEQDVIEAGNRDLTITFIGHGTLMLQYDVEGAPDDIQTVVHVDPVGREADYSALPRADLVLVTHEHGDHLDAEAIRTAKKEQAALVLTEACEAQAGDIPGAMVLKNGDKAMLVGLDIEAVPAYNIVNERSPGQPFHPKGSGNGYVITSRAPESTLRIYIAGDTENIPEMKALEDIDIAFLPMNLPYTMTPEMVADAAKAFRPRILYPYHYGDTDVNRLVELLADEPDIEVRVRQMQ